MEDNKDHRIELMLQTLLEMAGGNFNVRIGPSDGDDDLAGLAVLIDTLAQELYARFVHHGTLNLRFRYYYLIGYTFVLNQNFQITSYSHTTAALLGFSDEELYLRPFEDFLHESVLERWHATTGKILCDASFYDNLPLVLVAKKGFSIPTDCTVCRLQHHPGIIISSAGLAMQDFLTSRPNLSDKQPPAPSKYPDAQLIQRLYDFILANLEAPLPTVKELSALLGTNEHKLKYGFRHFFKTSIYQFYNDERLKRAHLLIEQTDLPLKSIAYMCGFNIYSNFSKAFKKRFGYAPNTLHRHPASPQE